jgi:predicted nucleic-acid-binding Zn-ribbon protein
MAEIDNDDEYIKCFRCKIQYHNEYAHIKRDFGYNRLEARFKTCIKCRDKRSKHVDIVTGKASVQKYTDDNHYYFEKSTCSNCGMVLGRKAMRRHEKDNNCPIARQVLKAYEFTRDFITDERDWNP